MKHVNSRLYKEVSSRPDVFKWSERGVYEILPGAEIYLSLSTRELIDLVNRESTSNPVEENEEQEGHEGVGPQIFAVGEPTITIN